MLQIVETAGTVHHLPFSCACHRLYSYPRINSGLFHFPRRADKRGRRVADISTMPHPMPGSYIRCCGKRKGECRLLPLSYSGILFSGLFRNRRYCGAGRKWISRRHCVSRGADNSREKTGRKGQKRPPECWHHPDGIRGKGG